MEESEGAIEYAQLDSPNTATNEKLPMLLDNYVDKERQQRDPKYLQLKAQDIMHHYAMTDHYTFKFTAQRVKINWLKLCGIDTKQIVNYLNIN